MFADFGPMLIAERQTKVYGRKDGGPGAAIAADRQVIKSHNTPEPDTPCKWWNMAFVSRGFWPSVFQH